jgi:hypothetical protein
MHRDHYRNPGRELLGKQGRRKPRSEPVAGELRGPANGGVQLRLPFNIRRDYSHFDRRQHGDLANPTLIRARRTARAFGEARGWGHWLASDVDRA